MSTPSLNIEEQAHALAEEQKWREAARVLLRAARDEPGNVRRWLQIVEWQREDGDARAAAKTLRDALKLNRAPHSRAADVKKLVALWEALAETLLEDQRWEDCIAACRSLLQIAPRHHWGRELLATALLHSDQVSAAEAVMRELLQLSPLDPLHRLRLATLLQLQDRPGEAMRELQYVIETQQPAGALRGEALEGVETLDKMQTQQILARAAEQWHFRTQLETDLDAALEEHGFLLSETGRETLRYILAAGGEDDDFRPPLH
jgi:predicted Zn-dependent protease